jgi:release factor glutamine methyltransferase
MTEPSPYLHHLEPQPMTSSPGLNTLASWMERARQRGLTLLETQCLMLKAVGQAQNRKVWLYTHDQTLLTLAQSDGFWTDVERRLNHVPLAYITQETCFYGLALTIDERALDPRSDTEILVEWALEILNQAIKVSAHSQRNPLSTLDSSNRSHRVVDLGCGSGAIALALKANAPSSEVWAVDQSAAALSLTQHNAQALGLDVVIQEGSWLEGIGTTLFDLIVSNPPYISPGDPHLRQLVHEPLSALVSSDEGMGDIRSIAHQARDHMKPGAWLLFEHGHDQSGRVRETLEGLGYINIQTRLDLAGIPRCTGGQSPNME